MSSASEPISTPSVRTLVRWGLPLHYAVPAACILLGVLLLAAGGTPAFFGGWWLATAVPVAIGGFFRARLFALLPVGLWIAWAVVGVVAGKDASIANTPPAFAAILAILGGVATLLAQRAVFPATDPEAWDHHADAAGAGEDGDETGSAAPVSVPPLLEPDEDEDLDPALADAFELTGEVDALPEEPEAETEPESEPEPEPAAVTEPEPKPESVTEPEPESVTETQTQAEPETAGELEPEATELPVGADPSPLDEGGHVTEFEAISED